MCLELWQSLTTLQIIMQAFTAREKVARMELLAMGLDPDINQGVSQTKGREGKMEGGSKGKRERWREQG